MANRRYLGNRNLPIRRRRRRINVSGGAPLGSGSAPTLTSTSPSSGSESGGTTVTVTGTGFQEPGAGTTTVTFDGVAGSSLLILSDTSLQVISPAGSGTVDVTITNSNGTDTLSNEFSYVAAPTVTDVSPSSGSGNGGESVTITGTGFQNNSPGTNVVEFGGIAATSVSVVNDTTITCDTPTGPFGFAVAVTVTNNNGMGSLAAAYTYHPLPTISGVSPDRGPFTGGTSITITGTGFQNNSPGTNAVTVGGVAATSVVVVNDTTITCDTPAGTSGSVNTIQLTNDNGFAVLTDSFTFNPMPEVTDVSPAFGPESGGTTVTITGTGFQNFSAGTNTVTVDGVPATSVSVVNDTTLTCDVPAGTGSNNQVTVSNNNGAGFLPNAFAYIAGPTVSSVSPSSGLISGGTPILVTGTGFQNTGAAPTSVTIDGVACTSVLVLNGTTISCTTPAGSAGAQDLVVNNSNGSDTLVGGFTYTTPNAPTVTDISPDTGDTVGGLAVTITGVDFQETGYGSNTVTIGGSPATSVVTVNDTTITCVTPAGSVGAQDVVVTNNNGSDTLAGGFTYTAAAAPTVTGISPDNGELAGGLAVSITGTDFLASGYGSNSVTIGGVACTSVVTVNDLTITCVTPAGSIGAQDVVVTNNNGSDTLVGGFTYNAPPAMGAAFWLAAQRRRVYYESGVFRPLTRKQKF